MMQIAKKGVEGVGKPLRNKTPWMRWRRRKFTLDENEIVNKGGKILTKIIK